jgi:hypothetical protein
VCLTKRFCLLLPRGDQMGNDPDPYGNLLGD